MLKNNINKKDLIIIASFITVLLLSLISARNLKIDSDIMSIFPSEKKTAIPSKRILAAFDPLNILYITVEKKNDTSTFNSLIPPAEKLNKVLEESGYFDFIVYKWESKDFFKTLDILSKHKASLYGKEDREETEKRLSLPNVKKRLIETRRDLATSFNPIKAKLFQNDPFGANEVMLENLNKTYAKDSTIGVKNGYLSSKNEKAILIIAKPKSKSGTDTKIAKKLTKTLDEKIKELEEEHNIKISYLSGHRYSLHNQEQIKKDIRLTILISTTLILLLIVLSFRRRLLALLALLPAFFGLIFSLGIMALVTDSFPAIVIGMGSLLIGISVDYGIHILVALDRVQSEKEKENALKHIKRPLFLSAFTTVTAFVIFIFSNIPLYRFLGASVSLGIIGAASLAYLFLPKIVPLNKESKKKKEALIHTETFHLNVIKLLGKRKKTFLGLSFIIVALLVALAIAKIETEKNINALNATTKSFEEERTNVLKYFGTYTASVILAQEGKSEEEVIYKNELLLKTLKRYEKEEIIEKQNSYSKFLISEKTQKKNRAAWNAMLKGIFTEKYRRELMKAAINAGYNESFIEKAINALLKVDANSFTVEDAEKTVMKNFIKNMKAEDEKGHLIIQTLSEKTILIPYPEFVKKIKNDLSGLRIYNAKREIKKKISDIFKEIIFMGILFAALLFIIMLIVFKKDILLTLTLSLTPVISVILALAITAHLSVKINVVNFLVVVFILGLLIDYSLFFTDAYLRYIEKKDLKLLKSTLAAIVISSLTTFFGFAALIFAKHPAIKSLGIMAATALVVGIFTTTFILPVVLMVIKKHDIS